MANKDTGKSNVMGSSINPGTNLGGISGDIVNPGISEQEFLDTQRFGSDNTNQGGRGSGLDANSDTDRLSDPENMQDKIEEDTFPASDPPSNTPVTGANRARERSEASSEPSKDPSGLPADFKDNPQAQFEYGRKSQKATHHFDRASERLENGNPDIGNVDLGTIEADKPTQVDDNDHYDTADDDLRKPSPPLNSTDKGDADY